MERPPQDSKRETYEVSRAQIRAMLTDINTEALTPEERSLLQSLLESLAPQATETAMSSEAVPPHETSLESRVQDAFEIIKTNQKLTFLVCAIGNVLNQPKGEALGVKTFYFDVSKRDMVQNYGATRILDSNPQNSNTLFQDSYTQRKEDGCTYIVKRLNIRPDTNNPFVTDSRNGVHLTLAVRFKPEDIDSFENELIAKDLRTPMVEFFSSLFDLCARTYIPAYYNYVQTLTEAHRARHAPPQDKS